MNIKKIVVLIVFFLSIKCLSQEFDALGYIQLNYYEYQELIKNGASSNLNGNFSIIRRGKEGKVINLEIKHYKDGKKTGEWISYRNLFGGLRLSFVANYKDNVLEGYYFESDNHTFSKKGFYKKGKKEGVWKESNGTDFSEITYKKDAKCGFFKSNDSTLKTKISGQYKKDKKDGVWIIEDTDTNEKTKEVYKDGELVSSN